MFARAFKSWWFPAPVVLAAALAVAFQGCRIVTYGLVVKSVAVTPANTKIAATTTQQFTASGTYNDDSVRDVTAEAAWSSSDPAVATVSASGIATPHAAGTTTITASMGGRSGSATLTVTNTKLVSLEVTPANPSIANGTRIQLAAVGHFDDGTTQDLTTQVTWMSSDATVTIGDAAGSKGLAASTTLGATTSTITATLGATSGFTTLTVKAVSLTSLSVTTATATIKVGQTVQCTATGTFSDGSTQHMTNEVTWSSSTGATIDSSGRATGVAPGGTTATITATSSALLGSVSGTAQLTVQACTGAYGC